MIVDLSKIPPSIPFCLSNSKDRTYRFDLFIFDKQITTNADTPQAAVDKAVEEFLK